MSEEYRPPVEMIYRSDGQGWLNAAWIIFVLAIILFAISFMVPRTDYSGELNPTALLYVALFRYLTSVAIAAWLGFLAIGCIIRAIYFLPGDVGKPKA